jgi:hypothetical protein
MAQGYKPRKEITKTSTKIPLSVAMPPLEDAQVVRDVKVWLTASGAWVCTCPFCREDYFLRKLAEHLAEKHFRKNPGEERA